MKKTKLDKETLDKTVSDFLAEFYKADDIEQYRLLSQVLLALFMPKDGYFIDTGSFKNVTAELIFRVKQKVEAHPWLWEQLFMIDPDGIMPDNPDGGGNGKQKS